MSELTNTDLVERRAWALDLVSTRPQIDLLLVDAINTAMSVNEIDRLLAGKKRRKQRSAPVHASALDLQLELNLELDHSGAVDVEMSVTVEAPEPPRTLTEESTTADCAAPASANREPEVVADGGHTANSVPDVPVFGRGRLFADTRRLQHSYYPPRRDVSHSVRGPPDRCDRSHRGVYRRHARAQPRSPPRRSNPKPVLPATPAGCRHFIGTPLSHKPPAGPG